MAYGVSFLADDVLILATGKHMAAKLVKALNATHLFLQTLGAMVAPNKSYKFASHPKVKTWIRGIHVATHRRKHRSGK